MPQWLYLREKAVQHMSLCLIHAHYLRSWGCIDGPGAATACYTPWKGVVLYIEKVWCYL